MRVKTFSFIPPSRNPYKYMMSIASIRNTEVSRKAYLSRSAFSSHSCRLFSRSLQEATIASQLLVAVRTRDADSLRRLCSSTSEHLPAALKRRDGQGHTLMHWAAKSGDVEMLELLSSEFGRCLDGHSHLRFLYFFCCRVKPREDPTCM